MRNRFDEQLSLLHQALSEMGAMCERAIARTARALGEGDPELAKRVMDEGSGIDLKEQEIEEQCIKLLLHQQPVAGDLRRISAALKIITDMERIGDQAEDIAELILELGGRNMEGVERIREMAQATITMVTESIHAYVEQDLELARVVEAQDDVVDNYFLEMKEDIIRLVARHPEEGAFALDLLMIAKYFERIGDHATNIAQWVIYAVTGEHKSLSV